MIRSVKTVDDVNTFLQNWNIDGTIFIYPHFDKNLNQLFKSKSIPMIFLDSYDNNKDLLSINIKDSKGTFLSTKYLINKGHKKIAFVANYEGNPLLTERFLGYKEALKSANIEFDETLIFKVDPNYEGGIQAGKRIADNKEISAAITTADICAIGILEGARLSGLSIPEELSVIGYDNLLVSTFTTPKLTTIDQHVKEKGEKAVELLFDRINKENKLPNRIYIDVDLIERQSVISKKNS
jgi:LacI family transcriptional regulator